jgi:hypothetical protein
LGDAVFDAKINALYWIEPVNEAINAEAIYSYTFNTEAGGLVLSTSDDKSLELLKKLASLVVIS